MTTFVARVVRGALRNIILLCGALILWGSGPAYSADVKQRIGVTGTISQIASDIRAWCSIKDWHPQVSNCETITDGASTYRLLALTDGSRVKERLIGTSADGYSYESVQGEPAVTQYKAKIWVEGIRDYRTVIHWQADFLNETTEPDAVRRINGFFYAGLANVKKLAIARWRLTAHRSPLADPFIFYVVLTWLGASVFVGWYTLRG